jgi:hypothetical protein
MPTATGIDAAHADIDDTPSTGGTDTDGDGIIDSRG